MEDLFLVSLLSRWLHVLTAIIVMGGTFFFRFVLMPAASGLSDEEHEKLRSALMRKWKIIVHTGIVLFLVTGFYNYLVVAIPQHEGQPLYHALMGMKILLAFGVFFLASALVGRAKAFEPIRQNRKLWLNVVIALAVAVVAIAGFLKVYSWS